MIVTFSYGLTAPDLAYQKLNGRVESREPVKSSLLLTARPYDYEEWLTLLKLKGHAIDLGLFRAVYCLCVVLVHILKIIAMCPAP